LTTTAGGVEGRGSHAPIPHAESRTSPDSGKSDKSDKSDEKKRRESLAS
jgi:hypothetical protein